MNSSFSYPLNRYELNSLLDKIRKQNFYQFNTQIEERIGCYYGYITKFTKSIKSISRPITNELIDLYENPKTYVQKRHSFEKRVPKQKIKTTETTTSSKDLLKKLKLNL